MKDNVLVTYATRYGTTAEIAETIAEFMREFAIDVTVMPIGKVFDLNPYSAVIIGSPIYMGRCLPELSDFVNQHQNMLHERPVIAFLDGYSLSDISETRREKALAALGCLNTSVQLREVGLFPGRVPSEGLSLREKAAMRMSGIRPGDYRNTEMIHSWVRGLVDLCLLHC